MGCHPWGSWRVGHDFHALEKEMATHSSVLAWRIPGMAEPDELPSMGSHRVGHNWSDLAAAAAALWGFTFCLLPPLTWLHFKRLRQLPAVSCLNAIGTWPSQGYLYLGLILIINTIMFTQANTETRNRNVHLTGGPAWRLNAFTGWRGEISKFNDWIVSWM